jgi:long-chain acyl-CoA synthetase
VLDADNYLKITDRKKDLIITAGGKNVAPQNIENTLKTFPLISQIVVLGDKQKYLAALITLNPDNAKKFAQDNGLGSQDLAQISRHPKIREALQKAIDEFNATQASYQTIKKFTVLDTDFSQETGELTPTLKVKRKFVAEKFKNEVTELFKD